MGKRNDKVNPQRQRVRFTKEFKLEAVRLVERGEKPAAQLALELGVARNSSKSGKRSCRRRVKTWPFAAPVPSAFPR